MSNRQNLHRHPQPGTKRLVCLEPHSPTPTSRMHVLQQIRMHRYMFSRKINKKLCHACSETCVSFFVIDSLINHPNFLPSPFFFSKKKHVLDVMQKYHSHKLQVANAISRVFIATQHASAVKRQLEELLSLGLVGVPDASEVIQRHAPALSSVPDVSAHTATISRLCSESLEKELEGVKSQLLAERSHLLRTDGEALIRQNAVSANRFAEYLSNTKHAAFRTALTLNQHSEPSLNCLDRFLHDVFGHEGFLPPAESPPSVPAIPTVPTVPPALVSSVNGGESKAQMQVRHPALAPPFAHTHGRLITVRQSPPPSFPVSASRNRALLSQNGHHDVPPLSISSSARKPEKPPSQTRQRKQSQQQHREEHQQVKLASDSTPPSHRSSRASKKRRHESEDKVAASASLRSVRAKNDVARPPSPPSAKVLSKSMEVVIPAHGHHETGQQLEQANELDVDSAAQQRRQRDKRQRARQQAREQIQKTTGEQALEQEDHAEEEQLADQQEGKAPASHLDSPQLQLARPQAQPRTQSQVKPQSQVTAQERLSPLKPRRQVLQQQQQQQQTQSASSTRTRARTANSAKMSSSKRNHQNSAKADIVQQHALDPSQPFDVFIQHRKLHKRARYFRTETLLLDWPEFNSICDKMPPSASALLRAERKRELAKRRKQHQRKRQLTLQHVRERPLQRLSTSRKLMNLDEE
eukprot:m.142024 g.142024  ORF g.142024 m.142024 type:complete len:695 (-) comp15986_c4_seq10:49-2133(-)